MLKTILVLPDGREISSGAAQTLAVQSCSYTQCVNAGTELTLGSVCACMAELKLWAPGGLSVAAGDRLTVYKDDGTARRKLGVFLAEKPERPTANTVHITAYDPVVLLDKDLTAWLAARTWPCSLLDLAKDVCDACGLVLTNTTLPNGSYLVQGISAQAVTGRQLMQWIGEAAGRFCRATADGRLEFAWYTPAAQTIGATAQAQVSYGAETGTVTIEDRAMTLAVRGSKVTVTTAAGVREEDGTVTWDMAARQHMYYQGGLRWADYAVTPIEKVWLRSGESDVGVIWPNTAGTVNTYCITGNPLLSGDKAALEAVAQTLYSQLQSVTYTPCTVTVPADLDIQAGQILPVTDRSGKTASIYVMTRRQSGQRDTLECTGSPRRDSTSAVNHQSYRALSGKVLDLRMDVDGLRLENKAADGRLAQLEADISGIRTQVQGQGTGMGALSRKLTTLEQTADSVKLSVQSIQEDGASKVRTATDYTFDEKGLRIAKSGEQMENRLDNTGMYVTRSGQTLLQANSDGVVAVDVQVKNYLCIGENSRLEDYSGDRTACFWTGG